MLNCSFRPNKFLCFSHRNKNHRTFCVLPLTICQYTRRGSHGNRATSSASPHQCSHRNRSDTCQSISRGESASAAVKWRPAVGRTSCWTHWVFPAAAALRKVLVGNLWISLRLNFLDTTAPWRSSNSSRAWDESADVSCFYFWRVFVFHNMSAVAICCVCGHWGGEWVNEKCDQTVFIRGKRTLPHLVVVSLKVFWKLRQGVPPSAPPTSSVLTSHICPNNILQFVYFVKMKQFVLLKIRHFTKP